MVTLTCPPAYLEREFRNPRRLYAYLLSLGESGACVAMVIWRS